MVTLWLRNQLAGKRIRRETERRVRELRQAPVLACRARAAELLAQLKNEPGPHVSLGTTPWGESVTVPLMELVKACGLTTGGMGSGKTMFALLPIAAMLARLPELDTMGFGVFDAKGELFDRALYLVWARAEQLKGAKREEFLRRVVVIDFSSRQALTSYNILAPWPHTDRDFFVTSRLETLRELLPAGEKLSLRGANVLKHVLVLLAESSLPLTYLEPVLSDDELRHKLLAESRNAALRGYFSRHFAVEGKQTIAALRARMETLLAADSVRLALAGSAAPDFCRLQNEGAIVLVNCAGPTITRGVRLLLQGLILSDIRQAIFARPNNPKVTYLWFADEAQNFFLTKQQQDNMADVLTMARSFGSFFYFLCQNLSASIPDSRVLEQLYTNIRWSLTLRGSPRDAQFLRAALPVSGRLARPDPHPFREPGMYSPEEERSLALDGIAHLPDREGYLWLKARSPEAIRMQTAAVELPPMEEFRRIVAGLRDDPVVGNRLGRAEYVGRVKDRDRAWLGEECHEDLEERWEKAYRAEEAVWQS